MVRKRLFSWVLAAAVLTASLPAAMPMAWAANGKIETGGKTPPQAAEETGGEINGKTPPETEGKRVLSDGEAAADEGAVLTEVSRIKTILDQLYGPDAPYGSEYDFVAGEVDPLTLIGSDGEKKNPKEQEMIDSMSGDGKSMSGDAGGKSAPPPGEKTPASSVSNIFEDVSSDQYFFEAIVWAVTLGITNGTTPTTFSPQRTCTRAQIITFLWRANQSPESTGVFPFPDVNPESDYGKAAHWAYKRGLVLDDKFRGDTPCTRAEAVTYLWKLDGGIASYRSSFSDVPPTESYAAAVAWAVNAGITKGTSDTTFSPNNTCTRGQIMTFLYRDFLYRLSAAMYTAEGQSADAQQADAVPGTLVYHESDAAEPVTLKDR